MTKKEQERGKMTTKTPNNQDKVQEIIYKGIFCDPNDCDVTSFTTYFVDDTGGKRVVMKSNRDDAECQCGGEKKRSELINKVMAIISQAKQEGREEIVEKIIKTGESVEKGHFLPPSEQIEYLARVAIAIRGKLVKLSNTKTK